jgi:hypothetical protein
METFWENIVSAGIVLLKVIFILLLIDLASIVFDTEMRVPYIYVITDWILAKASVLR